MRAPTRWGSAGPVCRSKCTYCNFASGVYPASEHTRYVERVIEEISGAASA